MPGAVEHQQPGCILAVGIELAAVGVCVGRKPIIPCADELFFLYRIGEARAMPNVAIAAKTTNNFPITSALP
jgi:hypothetical protein